MTSISKILLTFLELDKSLFNSNCLLCLSSLPTYTMVSPVPSVFKLLGLNLMDESKLI